MSEHFLLNFEFEIIVQSNFVKLQNMKTIKKFFQKYKSTVVGKDKFGNIYSVNVSDGHERRLVQHPTETFPDMQNLPVEW